MSKEFENLVPWDESDPHQEAPLKKNALFLKDKKGVVINCGENLLIAVRSLFFDIFRYNVWTERRETTLLTGRWHNVTDFDYMEVRSQLTKTYSDRVIQSASLKAVTDAVVQHCYQNTVDPAKDFFLSLYGEWDKIPRLDTWLTSVYHTPETAYYRSVGSNFIKGMVKRVCVPGSKFDTVLTLEGPQGIGKSTSLEILGGDWHVAITAAPDDKDFFMALQGHMLVEFAEGETLSRSEVKQLKSIISTLNDKYRAPYDREVRDHPRRCVFAMSTNQSEYLKDETGNRRWLPVECAGKIDNDWLRVNRTQLFAEAVQRVLVDEETTYEFPEDETKLMQDSRLIDDPEREKLMDWYFLTITPKQREDGISTADAFNGIQPNLGYMKFEKMTKIDQMKISSVFTNTLHLERRRTRATGGQVTRYYPTDKSRALTPEKDEATIAFETF